MQKWVGIHLLLSGIYQNCFNKINRIVFSIRLSHFEVGFSLRISTFWWICRILMLSHRMPHCWFHNTITSSMFMHWIAVNLERYAFELLKWDYYRRAMMFHLNISFGIIFPSSFWLAIHGRDCSAGLENHPNKLIVKKFCNWWWRGRLFPSEYIVMGLKKLIYRLSETVTMQGVHLLLTSPLTYYLRWYDLLAEEVEENLTSKWRENFTTEMIS